MTLAIKFARVIFYLWSEIQLLFWSTSIALLCVYLNGITMM